MAPVPDSDTPSQADTPMTDANEEPVTSVPVDNADALMTVRDIQLHSCPPHVFLPPRRDKNSPELTVA